VTALLATASRRFYLRHPWQLVLAVAGISLGVAVFTGVDLANDSARRAFDLSSQVVLGRTTHRLLPVGADLPETVYRELVTSGAVTVAAPVLEGQIRLLERPGRRYTLLGVDPLQESGFRGFSGWVPGSSVDFPRLMAEPGTVLVPREIAAELEARAGTQLEVAAAGRRETLVVLGTTRGAGAAADERAPFVADISTAQELLGRVGYLTRVDLVLNDGEAARLGAEPPHGTTLVSASGADRAFNELTRAFRTNLTALGLLALVVGAFLIYATMSFAVVQRRETFGVLRALGVDRRGLLAHVLLEAAGLAVVATAVGLALGQMLAQGLVDLVLRTIGDLYFTAAVSVAAPSAWIYVKGAALGVGVTLLAALAPAIDASATPPEAAMRRAALEHSTRQRTKLGALLALPVLAGAALLLSIRGGELFTAFAALAMVLAAGALLTPLATTALMRLIEAPAERFSGLPGLMAVRGVTASLSRTGVATAALAVAVAAVIGVGVMIASFRTSLIDWLDVTLTADLYLSTDASAEDDGFGPADLVDLRGLPEVGGLSLTRFVRLPTEHGELGVRAFGPGARGWGLDIVAGDPEQALASLQAGRGVAVAEPLAYRLELAPGDALELPTPQGARAFTIAGIFRDYNVDAGSVVMALETYRRYWQDLRLTSVGVDLHPSTSEERAVESVRARYPAVQIRSSGDLRRLSLEVFDRTFEITEVLRLLVGLVAFLGVLSALLSIQLERRRELAVLRSLGFAPRQLTTLVMTQTGLLGLAAGLIAVPLGSALAALLVFVINRRSFGWSMEFVLTPAPIAGGITLAVIAALLAGAYPAWRAGHVAASQALREE
jgi:putative ABC transport system permease protein